MSNPLEPQRTLYTYTWQAWRGSDCLWQESGLSAPDLVFRAMADGRDYVEIWQNGRALRAGTFAQTTHVNGGAQ